MEEGKFADAKTYGQASKLDPNNEALPLQKMAERKAKAQELKGAAEKLADAKDYANAVDTFYEALKFDPHNAEIQAERCRSKEG